MKKPPLWKAEWALAQQDLFKMMIKNKVLISLTTLGEINDLTAMILKENKQKYRRRAKQFLAAW